MGGTSGMRSGRLWLGPLAALLVACGTDAGPPAREAAPPVPSPPPVTVAGDPQTGLSGRLLQYRRDVPARRLQVRLTAAGGGLLVERLELRAPGLTAQPARPGALLRAGATLDLPVQQGDPDCAVSPGAPVAEVQVRDDAGVRHTVRVPLDDDGLLGRLHEADCARQALLAQADVSVAAVEPVDVGGRPGLRVTVRLTRVGGQDPVRVTGTGSNTVYSTTAVGPLPTLQGAGAVTLTLDMVPARCDVHALGESYRTGLVDLSLALGSDGPRPFVLTPDDDVRRRLETFAVETCRAGAD